MHCFVFVIDKSIYKGKVILSDRQNMVVIGAVGKCSISLFLGIQ